MALALGAWCSGAGAAGARAPPAADDGVLPAVVVPTPFAPKLRRVCIATVAAPGLQQFESHYTTWLGDVVRDYRPMATRGWNAIELIVDNPQALNERMRQSPFEIIGAAGARSSSCSPTRTLEATTRFYATQFGLAPGPIRQRPLEPLKRAQGYEPGRELPIGTARGRTARPCRALSVYPCSFPGRPASATRATLNPRIPR